jgi:hypothetical protein
MFTRAWILIAAALLAAPGIVRFGVNERPKPHPRRRLVGRCSPAGSGALESVDPIAGFNARVRPHVDY